MFQNNLLTLNIKTVYLEYGTTLEYKIENTSSYYYDYNFNIGIIGYIGNSKDLLYLHSINMLHILQTTMNFSTKIQKKF